MVRQNYSSNPVGILGFSSLHWTCTSYFPPSCSLHKLTSHLIFHLRLVPFHSSASSKPSPLPPILSLGTGLNFHGLALVPALDPNYYDSSLAPTNACLANTSRICSVSSTTAPSFPLILVILRFFFFPCKSDQNNLQLGPPCSLIFCNLFFLFFFFSFLITFFTCLLFSLYVFQHSLTAPPLLLACLSHLQASLLVWIASSTSFDHQSLDSTEILFLPIPLSTADITFVFRSPHTLSTSSSPTSLISMSLTQASHPWNSSSIASWNSSQLLLPSTLHLNLSSLLISLGFPTLNTPQIVIWPCINNSPVFYYHFHQIMPMLLWE